MKVKQIDTLTKEVIATLKEIKIKQKNMEDKEHIAYSSISFYLALKHNIFYKNLFLHPLVLKTKMFFEDKDMIKEENLNDFFQSIIEYELTADTTFLSTLERDSLIKIFKKKQNSLSEKNKTSENAISKSI